LFAATGRGVEQVSRQVAQRAVKGGHGLRRELKGKGIGPVNAIPL
jgi:hypothetical protein